MNITQTIRSSIADIPAGQIFGYQDLPCYFESSSAVIKAIGRMVVDKKLERLSKGKFYTQKIGVLGPRKPSDGELIRSMTYKNGCLYGYVTGPSLYNQLGLTTQIPRTITIASNGGRQKKELGTIRIKTEATSIPIKEEDVTLLQYLDALKDIKKISDSDVNRSLKIISSYILKLSISEQERMVNLAETYYRPQVRALIGLIFTRFNLSIPRSLALSLNPTTTYKLKLKEAEWPLAKQWNIQ